MELAAVAASSNQAVATTLLWLTRLEVEAPWDDHFQMSWVAGAELPGLQGVWGGAAPQNRMGAGGRNPSGSQWICGTASECKGFGGTQHPWIVGCAECWSPFAKKITSESSAK